MSVAGQQAQVRSQRQFKAGADGRTVDGSERRLGQCGDSVGQPVPPPEPRADRIGGSVLQDAPVGAGRECLPGAGEDDRAGTVIGRQRFDVRQQCACCSVVQAVVRLMAG